MKLENSPKNYHKDMYKVFKASQTSDISRSYEIWAKIIASIAWKLQKRTWSRGDQVILYIF